MNSSIGEERRGAKMLLYLGLLHTEMEPAPQQEGAWGVHIGRRTTTQSVRAGDNHDMDLAPPTGTYLTRRWARGPLSVHSDRVPSPTRQGRRRSGAATTDHGSELRWTGPEPPRAGPPGGLSHQASQAQASGPPLPTRAGVRSRHVPLWARPPTLGYGAATCPTGASLPPEASPPAALNDGG